MIWRAGILLAAASTLCWLVLAYGNSRYEAGRLSARLEVSEAAGKELADNVINALSANGAETRAAIFARLDRAELDRVAEDKVRAADKEAREVIRYVEADCSAEPVGNADLDRVMRDKQRAADRWIFRSREGGRGSPGGAELPEAGAGFGPADPAREASRGVPLAVF